MSGMEVIGLILPGGFMAGADLMIAGSMVGALLLCGWFAFVVSRFSRPSPNDSIGVLSSVPPRNITITANQWARMTSKGCPYCGNWNHDYNACPGRQTIVNVDEIEEEDVRITGWRSYSEPDFDPVKGLTLQGRYGTTWDTTEMTATCRHSRGQHHIGKQCSNSPPCGIYAYKNPSQFTGKIAARCSLWGLVADGKTRYRAEHCRIEELFVVELIEYMGPVRTTITLAGSRHPVPAAPTDHPVSVEPIALIEGLRARYGVPVTYKTREQWGTLCRAAEAVQKAEKGESDGGRGERDDQADQGASAQPTGRLLTIGGFTYTLDSTNP